MAPAFIAATADPHNPRTILAHQMMEKSREGKARFLAPARRAIRKLKKNKANMNDACFDAQVTVEDSTFTELERVYSLEFLSVEEDSCPIVCFDPSDDPFNPTLPPVDVVCTFDAHDSQEYQSFLAQYEETCSSLDGRIEYIDLSFKNCEPNSFTDTLLMLPTCYSNKCTKKQAVAWEIQFWDQVYEQFLYYEEDPPCEDVTVKISKMKLPKVPKGCNRPKVPKADKAVKAAKSTMKQAKGKKTKKGGD
jgi:hypothetical protein